MGLLHVAGRGLTLKDEALYYTLRFRCTTAIPILPTYANYLYIYLFFIGEELLGAYYKLLDVDLPFIGFVPVLPNSQR